MHLHRKTKPPPLYARETFFLVPSTGVCPQHIQPMRRNPINRTIHTYPGYHPRKLDIQDRVMLVWCLELCRAFADFS